MHEAQPPVSIAAGQPRLAGAAAVPALAVLVLVLTGATLALSILTNKGTWLDIATGLPIPLSHAGVGVVVARHQPGNPIGWLLILFVVLFPDGRLASRRWRWVLSGYAVAVAYLVAANLVPALAAGRGIHVDSSGYVTGTSHLAHLPGPLTAVAYGAAALIWLSFVGHQVLSWRHATGSAVSSSNGLPLVPRSPCVSARSATRSARPPPPPSWWRWV